MVDEYAHNTKYDILATKFRFLYGRWIQSKYLEGFAFVVLFRFLYGRWILIAAFILTNSSSVQIPLWSMNTWTHTADMIASQISSDSSMVDEYGGSGTSSSIIFPFRFLYGRWIQITNSVSVVVFSCSDSSMVDEYHIHTRFGTGWNRVQIPLWSMNTLKEATVFACIRIRSDSSMVDEYEGNCSPLLPLKGVQIPLWSMNTSNMTFTEREIALFRFLYGRWIRSEKKKKIGGCKSSDSSMVDEYQASAAVLIPAAPFRFLYGRWIPHLLGEMIF